MRKLLSLCAVGSIAFLAACASNPQETPYEQTEAYKNHLAGSADTFKVSRRLENGAPARPTQIEAAPEAEPMPAPAVEETVREDSVQPVTGSADAIFDDRLRK